MAAAEGGEVAVSLDSPALTRDLEAARKAYASADPELSRAVHEGAVPGTGVAKESHGGLGSDYIRNVVFGGMDGIITTFSIVAALAGSNIAPEIIILTGFSNVLADAISMGLGDFISTKSEHDYIRAERKREAWEYDNFAEGEVVEMIELYQKKGFSEEDASLIIRTMSKPQYREHFVDHMMVEELGQLVPSPDDSPAKDGFVTFISFIIFGSVPMWVYVIFHLAGANGRNAQFGIACAATAVSLFMLGVVKARIVRQEILKSGLLVLLNGAIAAAAAYFVGWGLAEALSVKGEC